MPFFVAGLAAPAFLFLAGTGVSMSIGGRLLRGEPVSQAVARAGRRALQVFGLAFLFRLQAFLISGGDPLRVLFKVDVLNVMGLGMLAAVVLWALGRSTVTRAAIFVLATFFYPFLYGLEVRLGNLGQLPLKLALARKILAMGGVQRYVDVSVPERPVAEPRSQSRQKATQSTERTPMDRVLLPPATVYTSAKKN